MKTAFSTLGCTGYSLEEILSLAGRYGVRGLEFRGVGGVLDNAKIPEFSTEGAPAAREKIAAAGLVPVVLGTSCAFHDPKKFDAAILEGIFSVGAADRLGAPFIRVFGNKIPDGDAPLRVAEGIAAILRATADHPSVSVLLEVHGDFNRVETLAPVAERLAASSRFGLIWDVKHTDGGYGDDWAEFYGYFRPLIRHVHIKDAIRAPERLVLPGKGELPLRAILSLLEADRFGGFVSLEWERKWHPELPPMEDALEAFARLTRDFT